MSHAHQVSTALQALSAVSKPKAIQTSFGSAQEPLHAGNPYQVERDAFGVIVPLNKLYKNRNLIAQICSKVRRGKHADKPLSDLLRSLASYKTRARPETNDPINYVCALAYDDMIKCEINRETALNTCSKVEAVLRERLQRIGSKRATNECTRYDFELNNPHSQFNTRIHAIYRLYRTQAKQNYAGYLKALYTAYALVTEAKQVLSDKGKRQYELFIAKAGNDLLEEFITVISPAQGQTVTTLLKVPFRRSSDKDMVEIELARNAIDTAIEKYRYQHVDRGYEDYADYIASLIPHDKPMPPALAKLLVHEAITLHGEAKNEECPLEEISIATRSLWNRPKTKRQYEVIRTIIDGFAFKTHG